MTATTASIHLDEREPRDGRYLKTIPWGHQRQAIDFLRRTLRAPQAVAHRPAPDGGAAYLAMYMGTGKTLVGVSMICNLPIQTVLIVSPLRVVDVWPQQIQQHAGRNDLRVLALGDDAGAVADKTKDAEFQMGVAKAAGHRFVVIVNYESMWREPFKQWALKQQWGLAILDEAHRIKEASGKQSMFAARLRERCVWRLALSGTPLPHSPLDAYAQYRFLRPDIFGTSYQTFKMRYAVMGGFQNKMIVSFRDLDDLEFRMKQIMFRVGKDVLDLPPEHRYERTCVLSPGAAKIYAEFEREFVAEVKNGTVTAANAMVKLLRLQQFTGGFAKTEAGDIVPLDPFNAKAELLAEILEDLPADEPVVIFCRFHQDLNTIHEIAKRLGRESLELSGRRDELKTWQAGGPPILAAQIQSGGIGVDLTRAAYSIYYSLGYSLGEYDQSLARVHRPGQTRPVAQIMLVASGTVDNKVIDALQKRMNIVNSILENIKESA